MEKTLKEMSMYLITKGYQRATIEGYILNARDFLKWLEKEEKKLRNLSYAESLKWVGVQQGRGKCEND